MNTSTLARAMTECIPIVALEHVTLDRIDDITLLGAEEWEAAKDIAPKHVGWWWLRLIGTDSNCAAGVLSSGGVDILGFRVYYAFGAVRPAFKNSKSRIRDRREDHGRQQNGLYRDRQGVCTFGHGGLSAPIRQRIERLRNIGDQGVYPLRRIQGDAVRMKRIIQFYDEEDETSILKGQDCK